MSNKYDVFIRRDVTQTFFCVVIIVMASGRVQVATTGLQDEFLTGTPDLTYFQKVFKRHTKFALELLDNPFDEEVDFGSEARCVIGRRGDLIRNMYLRIQLPAINEANVGYTASIGNAIIDYADLLIGGKRVERITGEYMEIYDEMFISNSLQRGLWATVGKTNSRTGLGPATTANGYPRNFIVNLPFYFHRSDPLAIPLVSLERQEVEVVIKFRPWEQLLVSPDQDYDINNINPRMINASLPVEYVFLSEDEQRWFRTRSFDYVITQLQMQKIQTTEIENSMELKFINPVKELFFIIQNTSKIVSNIYTGNDWFDYFNSNTFVSNVQMDTLQLDFNNETMIDASVADNLFLGYVQPLNRHSRVPQRQIYNYSFSLDPENYLPTGQVNMSRINNKLLKINLNETTDGEREIRVYAKSYNVLRVNDGIAGMLFIDNNVF